MGKILNYNFVLPQSSSGTFQFIKEEVLEGQDPKNAEFALTDSDVVKKVLYSSSLIGIVSFNTIRRLSKDKVFSSGTNTKILAPGIIKI